MSLPGLPPAFPIPDLGGFAGVAGRAAEAFAGDLLGLKGIAGKVADPVIRIRDFAQEQIDALLNGAASATRGTVEFVEQTLQGALAATSPLDGALDIAQRTVDEVRNVPERAMELLEEGLRTKQTALERKEAIKKHHERLKQRRKALPQAVYQHFEEIGIEMEDELDLEAEEAQRLGDKVEQDTRQLYGKTLQNAEHYTGILIRQTEQNRERAAHLKQSITGGIDSIKTWAGEQVGKAERFKAERTSRAAAIANPLEAERWATESIEGAHHLAGEMRDDLSRKPDEARTFGRARIDEAMALAQGMRQEVQTAKDWAITQSGNNAAWKRAMRETRNTAESFLRSQAARVEIRVEQHADAILETGKELSREQLEDTGSELGKSADAVERTFEDAKRTVVGDEQELRQDLKLPEPKDREHTVEVRREAEEQLPPPEQPQPLEKPDLNLKKASRQAATTQIKPTAKARAKPGSEVPSPKSEVQPLVPPSPPTEIQSSRPQPLSLVSESQHPRPKTQKPKSDTHISISLEEPSSSVPQPSAPSPIPIPYPNIATAGHVAETPAKVAKTEKSQSVPPIAARKKELPKLAGQQAASIPAPPASQPSPSQKATFAPQSPLTFKRGPELQKAGDSIARPPSQPVVANVAAPPSRPPAESDTPSVQRSPSARRQQIDPKTFRDNLIQAGGRGEAPDPTVRQEIGKHVGFDPSMVRFHTGPAAQMAAQSVNADAFTIGHNVFFGAKKFDPRSPKGLGLIGHEITHVGQQLGLKGNRMQFATKTGGDAMEQEAIEVGERIASNLAYADGFRVAQYIRAYEPADDEAISPGLSFKLDRLSMAALRKAGRLLSTKSRALPLKLDLVDIFVLLDLEELSDAEAIDVWAEAIVSAVEMARPSSMNAMATKEAMAPATHILQKASMRDLNAEANALPEPEVDEESLERIAKISATQDEIKMIQKLLVKPQMDSRLELGNITDIGDMSSIQSTMVRPSLELLLSKYEIDSIKDYVKLQEDFVKAFQKKGVNVTNYLLDESHATVQAEKKKYKGPGQDKPGSSMNSLVSSSAYVLKAARAFIEAVGSFADDDYWQVMGSRGKPTTGNIDSFVDTIQEKKLLLFEDPAVKRTYQRYMQIRLEEGETHPILLGRDFDASSITDATSIGKAQAGIMEHFDKVETAISEAKSRLTEDKFWELPAMITLTKKQMGVREEDGANRVLNEFQKERAEDKFLWEMIKAGAGVTLAVAAALTTGGVSFLAMAGMASLGAWNASLNWDNTFFKKAAVIAAVDQAKLIAKDDPSLVPLAIDLIGAGMDFGGAVWALGKLAKAAYLVRSNTAALKEMESVARDVYKSIPEPRLTRDEFVSRLLDTARRGVNGADEVLAFANQARVLTELLEGTSERAVRVLKGDAAAIQEFVMSHGNWRGLMGALENGGPHTELMAAQMSDWRRRIVQDLKSKNATTIKGASEEAASDFDMNIGELLGADGTVLKGAGQNLIDLEKDMIAKYGPNWESALHMHFYTEGTRLLAIDDVIGTLTPKAREAIMKRLNEKAEMLNYAKMLHHAGDDPFAREQVLMLMDQFLLKHKLAKIQELADNIAGQGRDSLLKEVDDLMAQYKALPPNSPKRIELAEKISEKQMETNLLIKEAYISPAALKTGKLNHAEAYQSALAQLEMIQHVIKEAGGDIVKACRDYEIYKYISRYVAAAKAAGIKSPTFTYFESLSNHVYRRARSAHMKTGHLSGELSADEAMEQAVSPQFLFESYGQFMDEVQRTLPTMRTKANLLPTVTVGGKAKATPLKDAAAAKAAKAAEKSSAVGDNVDLSIEPSKMKKVADKAWEGMDIITSTGSMAIKAAKGVQKPKLEPVRSAGFSSTRSSEGYGLFKGRLSGATGEVWFNVYPENESYLFQRELAAAMAAAKTGFGPKVYGKVDLGEGKLAFATATVSGGFADDFNGETHTPGSERAIKNRAEMLNYAKNITPQTFMDVDDYREKIWEAGFRYWHVPQGFVTPEGRWRPVDFAGASPLLDNEAEILALERETHDKRFDELKERLMNYHMEAKRGAL